MLVGVDADGGRAVIQAEQLLGDHAAEGVADQDRPGRKLVDEGPVVIGDVIDAVIGDAVRVGPGDLDGIGVAGPAGRERLVARGGTTLPPLDPAPDTYVFDA